jgi:transcriptional regulator with XRE-family HTH domain
LQLQYPLVHYPKIKFAWCEVSFGVRKILKGGTGMIARSQDLALGKRVRNMRQQAGVSQRMLAKRLGILHYQTVQKWETGERPLSLGMLAKIADALGHRAYVNGRERTAYVKALFRMGEPEEPTGWLENQKSRLDGYRRR